MENSVKQQQETPKKQWIEPAMESIEIQKPADPFESPASGPS
jgi:hypothetical protein